MSKTYIDLARFTLSGPTMGSRWTATLFAPSNASPAALGGGAGAAAGGGGGGGARGGGGGAPRPPTRALVGGGTEAPADLAHVLAASLRIGRATQGAFDIGVGAAVAAWGVGAQAAVEPAPRATLASLAVDMLDVDEARGRARKRAAMSLDLSAIAKGFGVDALARALDGLGVTSYLVGIDGEMRAKGVKPDGVPYAVALERPEVGLREAMAGVDLEDAAIATSGDYRRTRQGARGRYSHTIDPRTGAPLDTAVASVTVLAPTAMEADAFATGLMALGAERGLAKAKELGLDALFLLRRAAGIETRGTGTFAPCGDA